MTELDAINRMLAVIGEAPVDSLSSIQINEITDSALARRTLAEVNRDVQAEGWSWNTDEPVELGATAQNEFVLPPDTLSAQFSPTQYSDCQYVQRGLKVYDRQKQTYAFADDVGGQLYVSRLIRQLDWDQLPHQAQEYISIRAARIYSDRFTNSTVIFSYTSGDETYARSMLIRSEESSLNNNLLWGNDRGVGQGLGYLPAVGTRYRTR